MRRLFIVILLCASSWAHGACSGSTHGKSRFATIDISDGGCETQEIMITFTVRQMGESKAKSGSVKFSEECTSTKDGFFCRKSGRTPLAGATFKLTYDAKPSCEDEPVGERLTCVAGCSELVPTHLEIEPYEC